MEGGSRRNEAGTAARHPGELHALLEAAFNSGDVEAVLLLYEDDVTQTLPPTGDRICGRAALRAALAPILALRPTARMEVVGELAGGGLALTHGRWQLDGVGPDGNRTHLEGRGTIVSRRQPDGSWRIVLDDPMTPA